MSVKRYALEHERGESNTFGCPDGDYVLFKDYAALEARCAGLERERDDLQQTFDLQYKADMRGIEAWQKSTGKTLTWPDRARLVEWMMSERDALGEILSNIAGQFGQEFSSSYGHESIQHDIVDLKDNRDIWQGKVEGLEKRAKEAEAKLAAAEEALLEIASHGRDKFDRDIARAALADTTTDEVQP